MMNLHKFANRYQRLLESKLPALEIQIVLVLLATKTVGANRKSFVHFVIQSMMAHSEPHYESKNIKYLYRILGEPYEKTVECLLHMDHQPLGQVQLDNEQVLLDQLQHALNKEKLTDFINLNRPLFGRPIYNQSVDMKLYTKDYKTHDALMKHIERIIEGFNGNYDLRSTYKSTFQISCGSHSVTIPESYLTNLGELTIDPNSDKVHGRELTLLLAKQPRYE